MNRHQKQILKITKELMFLYRYESQSNEKEEGNYNYRMAKRDSRIIYNNMRKEYL